MIADAIQCGLDPAHHLVDPPAQLPITGTGRQLIGRLRILQPAQVGSQQLPHVRDAAGQRSLPAAKIVAAVPQVRSQPVKGLLELLGLLPQGGYIR